MATPQQPSLFSDICKPEYEARLKEIIAQKQGLVVSTSFCKYSIMTKQLLEQNQIEFNEIQLDEVYGIDQLEVANCIYGKNSRFVPLVYLNQQKIGGYSHIYALNKSGQLKANPVIAQIKQSQ